MNSENIHNVSIIGAGTMGNGIAHVFAQYGFAVKLIDSNSEQLQKALKTITANFDRQVKKGLVSEEEKKQALNDISTADNLIGGVKTADLVIEAATENIEVKLKIFRQINELAPENAVLASNTSSISITKLASATTRPQQVIGMHFMNPVPVMKLVEIINGFDTSAEVIATISALTEKLGKVPCVVNDYPGFISNRILMPMINEAIFCLYEGVTEVKVIDDIMKLGMAHPMGPLQLADFIGLDICLSILNVLYDGFGNSKYAPCPLLVNMVNAGKTGVKAGEGFYTYNKESRELIVNERFKK